jgi:hypothetical protein
VFPELASVATAIIDDVLPIAVSGNEKEPGLTVNWDEAGGGEAPKKPELVVDDGGLTLGAAGGRSRMRQPATSAIHVSITANESQWLRLRII